MAEGKVKLPPFVGALKGGPKDLATKSKDYRKPKKQKEKK